MSKFEDLDELMFAHAGMIHTSQAWEAGISKSRFYDYVQRGNLLQVAPSIYAAGEDCVDPIYLIHLRCIQAIFSHETALFLHDLILQEPSHYSITVGNGYNPSNLRSEQIQIYTVKRDLYELGAVSVRTPMGHVVPAYGTERTICDLIRSRSRIDEQVIRNVLKQYFQSRDRKPEVLRNYAKKFRVDKVLLQYLKELSFL